MKNIRSGLFECNLYGLFRSFHGFGDFIWKSFDGYEMITSRSYQWPGYVMNLHIPDDEGSDMIQEVKSRILSNEIPPFLLIDPTRVPLDFEDKLDQIDVRKIDFWPVIHISLQDQEFHPGNPAGFNIIRVLDSGNLKIWYDIVMKILFPGKTVPFHFFAQNLNNPNFIFYSGILNQLTVATGMIYIHDNIPGFYMVATLPEFRNRGIGAEIVRRMQMDSKKSGYDYLTAQSSRMAYPLYLKEGFTDTNTIDVYWMLGKEYNH